MQFISTRSAVCVCVFYPNDAGSLGHALHYAGLIAVLEEDGSVVVHVLHLHKHGGRARPAAAGRTVVCVQKQIGCSQSRV